MASVRLDHLSKRFGALLAVNDLTLDISEGEVLVLLGPSGCGKSTTLRLIAGLEEPSAGAIYIGERLVNDLSPKDRDVLLVCQGAELYPHMSVYDNLAFGLKLRHQPAHAIAARVQDAVQMHGLDQVLRRRPPHLSGGERQRVAFSRATVRTPQVVLLDEAPAHLDAPQRQQVCTEILALQQRLRTPVVYVTHDQSEALSVATRIAVLRDGVLQQVAPPRALYAQPANLFVAGFLGSPAMNLLPAVVQAEGETLSACTSAFRVPVSPATRAALARYRKRAVILGVRPEDVCAPAPRQPVADTGAALPVEVVERTGSATYVYLRAGQSVVVARLDARSRASVGQSVEIAVDASRIHLFDPDTEQALPAW